MRRRQDSLTTMIWRLISASEYSSILSHMSFELIINEVNIILIFFSRIYMVTGSNSGLGKSTALALAKKGNLV